MKKAPSLDTIEYGTSNSNLERGRLLYQKGMVQDFKIIDKTFVRAKVSGNRTYKVVLEYKNDNYRAYCNCLFEPKGYCKHQVAVKYTLIDFLNEKPPENQGNSAGLLLQKVYHSLVKYGYRLRYRFSIKYLI